MAAASATEDSKMFRRFMEDIVQDSCVRSFLASVFCFVVARFGIFVNEWCVLGDFLHY